MAAAGSQRTILRVLWSLNRGGAETRAVDLATEINSEHSRVDFLVLSGKPAELDERATLSGSKVIRMRVTMSFPLRFLRLVRERQPDVVHCQLTILAGFVMGLAFIAGVKKRVTSYHNTHVFNASGPIDRVKILVSRTLVRVFATKVLAVSSETMTVATDCDWTSDDRYQVVYQGFPVHRPDAALQRIARDRLGVREGAVVFVNVGNFRDVKNQIRTLEIFREFHDQCSNAHLLFVGGTHGHEESEANFEAIEAEIGKHELSSCVSMLGNRDDVNVLLSIADLMLFTSIDEGCANVIWESVSQGTPVVSSEHAIIDELGPQLPGVTQIPLSADNETWVQACRKVLAAYAITTARRELKDAFDRGPLSVETVAQTYRGLYGLPDHNQPSKRAA